MKKYDEFINSDIKNEKIGGFAGDREFKDLIIAGDNNVNALKYTDAITNYKDALKIKPNEPDAVSKLAEAENKLILSNSGTNGTGTDPAVKKKIQDWVEKLKKVWKKIIN